MIGRMGKLAAVSFIAATLALTACGNATPTAATKPATTSTRSTSDVGYLATVRPEVQGSSDDDLIRLGHQACDDLDSNTVLDVASKLNDEGLPTGASAAIVTAAINSYCPQHKDKLGS